MKKQGQNKSIGVVGATTIGVGGMMGAGALYFAWSCS